MGRRWSNQNNQNGTSEQRGRWSQAESASAGPNKTERALDTFAEMMIEKIEAFQGDWKKPWFSDKSLSWPKNLSGREYNGMNAMMLMMQCEKQGYKIPVFMTHDRIFGLNTQKDKQGVSQPATDENGEKLPFVHVNKGEKSFPVFITTFTVVDPETKAKISYDDYRRLSEEERSKYQVYPKLNVYNVFNVDQTNLKEARPELYEKLLLQTNPQRPERTPEEMFTFPAMDRLIANNEWICPIKPTHGDDAYYSIAKNEIVVPEKEQFKDGESFYTNTFHEMAHSTGAEGVLGRLKPSSFGDEDYGREELVAELTAALSAQRYGMEKNIKSDSVAYLSSWLDSLKKEPAFIKTVLTDVKKAEQIISSRIDAVQLKIDNGDETRIDVKTTTPSTPQKEEEPQEAKTESEEETVTDSDEKKLGGVDIDGDGEVEADECHEEKTEIPHRGMRR